MTSLFDNFSIPPIDTEDSRNKHSILKMRQAIARGYTSPKRIKLIDFDKENQQFVIRNPEPKVGAWRPKLLAKKTKKGKSASVRLGVSQAPDLKKLILKSVKPGQKKMVNQKLMNKPCPPGKVRNPDTGRCINAANLSRKQTKRTSEANNFASLIKQIKQLDLN
jgi:hypothetical protein